MEDHGTRSSSTQGKRSRRVIKPLATLALMSLYEQAETTHKPKELNMDAGRENYDNDAQPKTTEDGAADEAAKSAGNDEVTKEIERQNDENQTAE